MMIDLEKYKADPDFHFLHWEFGELLVRRGNVADEHKAAVILLGAKCLQAIEQGHTCLDLQKWHDQALEAGNDPLPSPEKWSKIIAKYPQITGICAPDQASQITPLLYDGKLLYLHKFYHAEKEIALFLRRRLNSRKLPIPQEKLYSLIHEVNTLFKNKKEGVPDDPQQQAVAMALTHDFSILTGGPGTGKTTVLATILAMEQHLDPLIRIGLAAPTGKAAVQMLDSLHEELATHLVSGKLANGVIERLRTQECSTIHRLLGISRESSKPYFNQANPLPYDLVVIDESSMVSLQLMQQLCRAVAPDCRLLLIGDQNQLAAVDAGCLLGDFCSRCKLFEPSGSKAEELFITRLIENHRSDNNPALKEFIRKINLTTGIHANVSEEMRSDIDALYSCGNQQFRAYEVKLEGKKNEKQKQLEKLLSDEISNMLSKSVLPKRFEEYFGQEKTSALTLSPEHWCSLKNSPESEEDDTFSLALAHFYTESLRIICGTHEGDLGEINLNKLMQKILKKKMGEDTFPVIVLQNAPALHLNNGDVGICWKGKVYFPRWRRNGNNQWEFDRKKVYSISQLPLYGTAYAMTIHKSQGSGFDNVIMTLPEKENLVLCRELIYTGISRTKRNFLLWSSRELFCSTIDRESSRWSGMANWLNK